MTLAGRIVPVRHLALLLLIAAGLAGCATPTPYAPATDRYGYSESPIEQNRFRVSFSGNSATDRETVETYLLYRAAELTLEKGGSHFAVVARDLDKNERYVQHDFYPFGFGSYGYYGPHSGYFFRHTLYTGPSDSVPITRYEAVAEIVVGGPELKAEGSSAYDARDVIANLGPKILRSPG